MASVWRRVAVSRWALLIRCGFLILWGDGKALAHKHIPRKLMHAIET